MVDPNQNQITPENIQVEHLNPTIALADVVKNGFIIPSGEVHASSNGETVEESRRFGKPGDTITGIESAKDFEVLEHLVVGGMIRRKLELNRKRSPVKGRANEIEEPLSWKLRPRSYHGELTNGSAMVIDEPGKEEGTGALTFLFVADTKVGPIARAVTYRKSDFDTQGYDSSFYPLVRRKLHPNNTFNTASAVAEARAQASARESYKVASKGIRKAFSAGLPGTGRR